MTRTAKLVIHFDVAPGDRRMVTFSAMISDVIEYARNEGVRCYYEDSAEKRPGEFKMDEEA